MFAGYLALGLGAGILSGLFGIGGGILIVPVLITAFGMTVLHASATSLAALLLPVGILGVVGYYRHGFIRWRSAAWITTGLLCGSGLGAVAAVHAPTHVLEIAYSIFLIYSGLNYLGVFRLLRRQKPEEKERLEGALWQLLAVGFAAGIIAGLFGKGGGIVIVPMLMNVFHYETKEAAATSLAAMQLPVGLPGVLVYAQHGDMNWTAVGLIVLGLILGTPVGTRVAIGMNGRYFKFIYGFFLLGVAIFLLVR